MEILLTIGNVLLVLLAVVGVALPLIAERRNYEFVWSVWRRFRIKMFFECLGITTLTIAGAIALWQIPGLNYGWINLFFGGESGNMLVKPIMEGSESTSIVVRLMVPLFLVALAFVLPFLARFEERSFRKGHDEWGSIVKQSVKFGLVHCLAGVPLAAGIALIISGLFYGLKYKCTFDRKVESTYWRAEAEDEAVMVSITYHTMNNMIMVGLFLLIAFMAI